MVLRLVVLRPVVPQPVVLLGWLSHWYLFESYLSDRYFLEQPWLEHPYFESCLLQSCPLAWHIFSACVYQRVIGRWSLVVGHRSSAGSLSAGLLGLSKVDLNTYEQH